MIATHGRREILFDDEVLQCGKDESDLLFVGCTREMRVQALVWVLQQGRKVP